MLKEPFLVSPYQVPVDLLTAALLWTKNDFYPFFSLQQMTKISCLHSKAESHRLANVTNG